MRATDKINCTVDFEGDGKHFGNLELSFSDNLNAFAPHASNNVGRRCQLGQYPLILWWQHPDAVQLPVERSCAQSFSDYISQLMCRWSVTTA